MVFLLLGSTLYKAILYKEITWHLDQLIYMYFWCPDNYLHITMWRFWCIHIVSHDDWKDLCFLQVLFWLQLHVSQQQALKVLLSFKPSVFFLFCQQTPETTGIKFPDFKQPGVFVRSQKVKTCGLPYYY